ncbi:hypothetical protein [Streptosporangium sp. LJ11]|uniref:hypothetical protein n=1 Tax=Streptosporangium sp. LJ11 TaxID=3436927 RepID=UPI003F78B7D1
MPYLDPRLVPVLGSFVLEGPIHVAVLGSFASEVPMRGRPPLSPAGAVREVVTNTSS